MFELVKMWALIEALGLLFLPLTMTVFHNLSDRGWAFSKSLGMTIFTFAVWLPLMCFHTLPYNRPFLWGVALVLIGASIGGFWLTRHTVRKVVKLNLSYIILTEIVFLVMVALMGFLRQFRPDIRSWETFMDEGIIAGIMRSPHLPPNDVWYAGLPINYYYYAHFAIATLGKTIGQAPSIVFNTGISIFFSLTAVNLFGITSNIVAWAIRMRQKQHTPEMLQTGQTPVSSPRKFSPLLRAAPFGLCSLAMGVLLGNLASAGQWWFNIQNHISVYEWFTPSRVIPSTINEFPAFSFLLSDFHAHVLTLAFTLLAVGVAFNLFIEKDGLGLKVFGKKWELVCTLFVSALILGQLFAMNGWDYPTYLALALVSLILQQWLAHGSRLSLDLLLDIFTAGAALGALSYLLFAPFYLNFNSPAQGLGLVDASARSPLNDEFLIYGLFTFLLLSFLLVSFFRKRQPDQRGASTTTGTLPEPLQAAGGWLDLRFIGLLATLVAVLVVLALLRNSATLAIMGGVAAIASVLTLYHLKERARSFTLLLGAVAFALVAFCEVVYLKDVFAGGAYFRMNTVFKFYFQAWIFLAVAGGSGLFFLSEAFWSGMSSAHSQPKKVSRLIRGGIALPWLACLTLLVLASLVYPILAPSARLSTYNAQTHSMAMTPTWNLDGMTYLQHCRPPDIYPTTDSDPNAVPFCNYDVTHDYAALRWINEHIQGDPVIVEAANVTNEDYSLYALVSSFTGLPTIMGWPGHEVQWRANWLKNPVSSGSFNQRLSDINAIYTNPNPQVVLNLMRKYNATYLYVGTLERLQYGQANVARFASFMQTVYASEDIAIYKLPA